MLHDLLHSWFEWVEAWGYGGVIILMAMESSIFPVPSEVVIPPAACWAVMGRDGGAPPMSVPGVILAGTFGSWLGSAITYALARWLGRPIVERWGRFIFCPPEKLARAETFLARYEAGGIFFARLLPVVRHLISIPAGIVRMPFGKFSLMTTLGAGIWCSVLAWFGVRIARNNPHLLDNPDALVHAVKNELWWIVGGVAVLAILYFLMLRLSAPRAPQNSTAA